MINGVVSEQQEEFIDLVYEILESRCFRLVHTHVNSPDHATFLVSYHGPGGLPLLPHSALNRLDWDPVSRSHRRIYPFLFRVVVKELHHVVTRSPDINAEMVNKALDLLVDHYNTLKFTIP